MQVRMTDTAVQDLDLNILCPWGSSWNCEWTQPRRWALGRECLRGKCEVIGAFFLLSNFCNGHRRPPKFFVISEYRRTSSYSLAQHANPLAKHATRVSSFHEQTDRSGTKSDRPLPRYRRVRESKL